MRRSIVSTAICIICACLPVLPSYAVDHGAPEQTRVPTTNAKGVYAFDYVRHLFHRSEDGGTGLAIPTAHLYLEGTVNVSVDGKENDGFTLRTTVPTIYGRHYSGKVLSKEALAAVFSDMTIAAKRGAEVTVKLSGPKKADGEGSTFAGALATALITRKSTAGEVPKQDIPFLTREAVTVQELAMIRLPPQERAFSATMPAKMRDSEEPTTLRDVLVITSSHAGMLGSTHCIYVVDRKSRLVLWARCTEVSQDNLNMQVHSVTVVRRGN